MHDVTVAAWPLMFTYSGPIFGRGYLASVRFCGRLLATPETEGVWLDGVNPGGMAAGGANLDDANRALRETLTKVLVAFASEADSFETFKTAVETFYHSTDDEIVAEWEAALGSLKQGTLPVPSGLPRKPQDWVCFVAVEPKRLEDLTPRDNPVSYDEIDTTTLAKAA